MKRSYKYNTKQSRNIVELIDSEQLGEDIIWLDEDLSSMNYVNNHRTKYKKGDSIRPDQ
jgi:hypothetical protein